MALPRNVVREDHRLDEQSSKASEALMRHRWHWTLDESNPERVSLREYARAVGKSHVVIRRDVEAHKIVAGNASVTTSQAREQAAMGVETWAATAAVAEARGVEPKTARMSRPVEVRRVREIARERAEKHGTSVEEEAPKVADWIVKSENAAEAARTARRGKTDLRVIAIEAQVLKAINAINKAIDESRGVEIDEDAIEFLEGSRDNLRKAWALLDAVLAGASDIDWDDELAKMTEVA